MVVSLNVLNDVKNQISDSKIREAIRLYEQSKVRIKNIKYDDENNFSVRAVVETRENEILVTVFVKDGRVDNYGCECSMNLCSHVLATLIELDENEKYENSLRLSDKVKSDISRRNLLKLNKINEIKKQELNKNAYMLIENFKSEIKNDELKEKDNNFKVNNIVNEYIKIIPKFNFENNMQTLEFYITDTQVYKIKNILEFADNIENNKVFKYGQKLEFKHDIKLFDEVSKKIIEYIIKYAKVLENTNSYINKINPFIITNLEKFILTETMIDEIYDILKDKKVSIINKDYMISLRETNIEIKLENINNEEYKLKCDIIKYSFFVSNKYIYFIQDIEVTRVKYNKYLEKILNILKDNGNEKFLFNTSTLTQFFTVIYPKIKKYMVGIEKTRLEKYIPVELAVKVFLDLNDNNDIIATVNYVYGSISFNPYKEDLNTISRDMISEIKVAKHFENSGFLQFSDGKLVIIDEENTYEFLTDKINEFVENYEVLITEKFKAKKVKTAKITNLSMSVKNNLLDIDLSNINIDLKELREVLNSYKLKKKYYKLNDGTFLNIQNSKDLETLNELTESLDISLKDISDGYFRVPIYRSMYLEKLFSNNKSIIIEKNNEFRNLINDIEKSEEIEYKLPINLKANLRNYQENGYKWLSSLDSYGFGGILADDMGLGKTLQIITLIERYIENNKSSLPTLVVCPSSLVLNWKNEINKFANNLKVNIISGKYEERKTAIKQINKYNVVITSYDSLKRDIDEYKKYEFRYVVADEAQYIKNANTQNSKAIKIINGKTRFALTGTPIENSLSELWSIFDYILPGYLYSNAKFKKMYEKPITKDEDNVVLDKLKNLVKPFILRRVKKEVLTELPEKNISILENEMVDKQDEVYKAHLLLAKKELEEEIANSGFEKSQIKILSLINRLRQICCHPSLFIENYKGGSSKVEQCLELIKEALGSNHKILLFSSYTSMFEILKKEFDKESVNYLELTGKTKITDRIDLVNEFNENDNVRVFLISLKAGGTGLNLTGADMVIHFDPWWNISAENQATDRAYRIGQKNNVQVYKLITKNSIEQKIFELQESKAKLIDSMLTTEETFINKLSKEDILSLFN